MDYPKIEKDVLIHTDRKEFKLYTDKVLLESLKTTDSPVEVSVVTVSSDNKEIEDRDWIYNSSLFDIYISLSFLENHFIAASKAYIDFLKKFDGFLEVFKSMTQIEGVELAPFSLYFELKNAYILKFLFHPKPKGTEYVTMLSSALDTIAHLQKEKGFYPYFSGELR